MTDTTTPETGQLTEAAEASPDSLIVTQPQKLESLLDTLTLLDRVSETVGEDRSGDLGSGSGGGQGDDDDQTQISQRDQAIANLPDLPIVQKKITKHINCEIKKLQKEVKKATRRTTKPGEACRLNKLYAKIRRLNSLLSDLSHASYEVLQRLYIKIFIDGQTVSQ